MREIMRRLRAAWRALCGIERAETQQATLSKLLASVHVLVEYAERNARAANNHYSRARDSAALVESRLESCTTFLESLIEAGDVLIDDLRTRDKARTALIDSWGAILRQCCHSNQDAVSALLASHKTTANIHYSQLSIMTGFAKTTANNTSCIRKLMQTLASAKKTPAKRIARKGKT